MAADDAMSVLAPSPSAVGGLLRATRLRHGLTVQDVSAALRIRRPYLDAIEDGRLADLPAPAYAIGFVKTYAAALGLDQEEIARRWRDETGNAAARRPELSFPAPVPERGIPAGALIVVGLILAVGLYGGWYYLSGTGQRVADFVPGLPERLARIEPAAPTAPAFPPPTLPGAALPPSGALPAVTPLPSQPASPQPAAAPTQPPAPGTNGAAAPTPPVAAPAPPTEPRVTLPATGPWPTGPAVTPESLLPARPQPSPTSASAAPLAPPAPAAEPPAASFGTTDDSRVLLRARADSWIQVRERQGGTVLFNRVLRPGETYRVPLRPGLLLTTGNAGGLEVVLDGDALPTLGQQGAVRRDLPLEPELLKQAVAALPR